MAPLADLLSWRVAEASFARRVEPKHLELRIELNRDVNIDWRSCKFVKRALDLWECPFKEI